MPLRQPMDWRPSEGGTLLIASGPTKHLFVIITAPQAGSDVAIANFTSLYPGYHDASCVTEPGEHPFLTRPSYVY